MFLEKLGKTKEEEKKMRRKLAGFLIIVLIAGLGCRQVFPDPAPPDPGGDLLEEAVAFINTNCHLARATLATQKCSAFVTEMIEGGAILCAATDVLIGSLCGLAGVIASTATEGVAIAPSIGTCIGLVAAWAGVCIAVDVFASVVADFGCCMAAIAENSLHPVVTITSPADKGTFGTDKPISFIGTGEDTDGKTLTDLSWTSDKDGKIGTGGSVSKKLTDGTHTITATVESLNDSAFSGSSSVTITVVAKL